MTDNTGNVERFKIVKSIKCPDGELTSGEINLVYAFGAPTVYFNGGMVPESYQVLFRNLIATEKKNGFDKLRPLSARYANEF